MSLHLNKQENIYKILRHGLKIQKKSKFEFN